MALVSCTECEGTVASTAPVCPHCGAPAPGGKTGKIVVSRKKAMTGFLNTMEIYLDGAPVGSLKNGESVTVNVLAGDYHLVVDTVGTAAARAREFRISIDHKQTLEFETGFSGLTGFYAKAV